MAAQRSREGVENIIKKEWIRFYNKCYNNALFTRVNLDAPPPPALGLSIRQHHRSVAPCGPLESEVGNREALGWIRFDTLIEWERERQEFSKLLLSFFFFFCCFCSNLGFFPMSATHMQDPTLPIILVTLFGWLSVEANTEIVKHSTAVASGWGEMKKTPPNNKAILCN